MTSLTERVDQIFAEWDTPNTPGCALAIIKDGKIIYSRGYGMANLELGVPLAPNSIFDIGSTSKQFTALCILMLARRGKLSLDDPIQKYLPEMPQYEQPITVRHLVHHTSGIRDYLTLMALSNMPFENDYQEPEVVGLIARQKALNFLPGEEYLYSNSGYFLMSEIVQRVSGQNLRDFAEENIFGPLGMIHTHFHNNFKEIVPRRAYGYSPKKDGGFEIDMGIFDVLGDGAVYTSVEDLLLWDRNYYDNKLDGGGQELIRQMEQVGIFNSGEKQDYAFGLRISTYKGLPVVDHGGSWYGYRAQMMRFPRQRFTVICLANRSDSNPDGKCKQVADIYLADLFTGQPAAAETPAETVELPDEVLLAKTGKYQDKDGGVAEITADDDALILEAMGGKFAIEPLGENHFTAPKAPARVDVFFENNNQTLKLSLNAASLETVFKRIADLQLDARQLSEYAGKYYSDELNITYELSAGDGVLNSKPETEYMKALKPSVKDKFSRGMLSLQFLRDESGKVSAFSANAGRVKDIIFKKL
jgi:CubicO group peptidase (beta-lactamase class C family)